MTQDEPERVKEIQERAETVKSGELIGKTVRIVVKSPPCRCVYEGCDPLTHTVEGKLLKFLAMPCGAIGFLEYAQGRVICFDAGLDIKAGIIEIELREPR